MITSRRRFLGGLLGALAAPLVVRAASIMPVKALPDNLLLEARINQWVDGTAEWFGRRSRLNEILAEVYARQREYFLQDEVPEVAANYPDATRERLEAPLMQLQEVPFDDPRDVFEIGRAEEAAKNGAGVDVWSGAPKSSPEQARNGVLLATVRQQMHNSDKPWSWDEAVEFVRANGMAV